MRRHARPTRVRGGRSATGASSSLRTSILTLPRSALETGQRSAASPTACSKSGASRPGTRARTVSWTVVIRGAPSTSSSVHAALTVRRSGGVLCSPRASASAIAKQLAWAPAMSSSGLVLSSGRSVRDAHVTGELVERAAAARQRPGSACERPFPDDLGFTSCYRHGPPSWCVGVLFSHQDFYTE